jgi:DNA-directed RNA polymerase subunit omega
MARVTVEDCIEKVPNRFDLVMLAAQRARNVSAGAELTVERDNDKNPVVALREIAEETINLEEIENALVQGLQKHVERDEPDEEDMELITSEQELMTRIAGAFSDQDVNADSMAADEDAEQDEFEGSEDDQPSDESEDGGDAEPGADDREEI